MDEADVLSVIGHRDGHIFLLRLNRNSPLLSAVGHKTSQFFVAALTNLIRHEEPVPHHAQ